MAVSSHGLVTGYFLCFASVILELILPSEEMGDASLTHPTLATLATLADASGPPRAAAVKDLPL